MNGSVRMAFSKIKVNQAYTFLSGWSCSNPATARSKRPSMVESAREQEEKLMATVQLFWDCSTEEISRKLYS